MQRFRLSDIFRGEAGLIEKGADASALVRVIGDRQYEKIYESHFAWVYGCFEFMFESETRRFEYASCRDFWQKQFDFPDFIDPDIGFSPRASLQDMRSLLAGLNIEPLAEEEMRASIRIEFPTGVVWFSKCHPEDPFDSVIFYKM
jgi:hypothetical protein